MNCKIILFAIILLFQIVIGLTAKNAAACFDVLNKLPKNEIENIYFMDFTKVAHTHPASDILTCYLHESHPGDKSVIEQYFDVYKKCDDFKEHNLQPFGKQQLQELVSLGLPYDLENYLRLKLQTGNKTELMQGILHVQDVMSKNIEASQYYADYKRLVLNKFKPTKNAVADHVSEKSIATKKSVSHKGFLQLLAKYIDI